MPLFRGFPEKEREVDEETVILTHRVLHPELLPELVGILASLGSEEVSLLIRFLGLTAEVSDRYRWEIAHGSLHALALLDAMSRGLPAPPLGEPPAPLAGPGLPEAFVRLARFRWLGDPDLGDLHPDLQDFLPPGSWLLRWARELTPAAKDAAPMLEEVANRSVDPDDYEASSLVQYARSALKNITGEDQESGTGPADGAVAPP